MFAFIIFMFGIIGFTIYAVIKKDQDKFVQYENIYPYWEQFYFYPTIINEDDDTFTFVKK